jgi:excinuclease ABC subunit A
MKPTRSAGHILIRGARQNNLKNLDLDLPANELIVVTGVSGSGKSSLVFDTLYAEGQRRYVETFSPYARQFLDRMDRPQVDRIEGIPPAIAIDQTNPVRTSRSTVGTMTELNDHLKLLFARAAKLHCRRCGAAVRRDTPETIYRALEHAVPAEARIAVTFPVTIPHNFSREEVLGLLRQQGYTRELETSTPQANCVEMLQDRLRFTAENRSRLIDALESALRVGRGHVRVHRLNAEGEATGEPLRFSQDLHCATCDIHYQDPVPSLFSFNSPVGACETCRGFGRVIGIDDGLVIPDESKTLREGAVRPWQTKSYAECQDDLVRFARKRGIPLDVPWRELTDEQRRWVLEGEGEWEDKRWYGVHRFFRWLETKAYKMHVRVLLSKYRAYTPCPSCQGARLKPEALLWRLGSRPANELLQRKERFRPAHVEWTEAVFDALPGASLHELMLMPIARLCVFFRELQVDSSMDAAADLVLNEIRCRLDYLLEVGLGYLTLDRQSRTLSGGEVQRINLTTALGTSLVNTLFVLDEPSIGLHPRDVNRVVEVMRRLKQSGNTLVVVEHDPQVMQAADRLLDMGPGPGERGGEIMFYGRPEELRNAKGSLTADYLLGRRRTDSPLTLSPSRSRGREDACASVAASSATLPLAGEGGTPVPVMLLRGAREHNLKGIDVELPLQRLVCVTGVSGSGKSTLVQDVLYPALLKKRGKQTEAPGAFDSLEGDESIGEVVFVDQSPIGRTTRSNPASYVGAFDAIRKLFAQAPLAKERGYTQGTFSFNSGDGRCPACGGNGFEHIEMQFLSDVYLRCTQCNGQRFRDEVLEVTIQRGDAPPVNIAQVLDMTVSQALSFFAADSDVTRRLQPLADVGLDYVRLGQPVPTLSGGEAQRLKLAGHLAESASAAQPANDTTKPTLFLFDEPTTGLHFDDIAKLLRAFQQLLAAGHSLLVIEHNLDVIRAADWIVDLGPEGGDEGGELVVAGTVADVMRCARSHTGKALREYGTSHWPQAPRVAEASLEAPRPVANAIQVRGAREHNLKNIDVELPRDCFTVITGVSGSGKSTLAFDLVFAEGQRRYLESLNAYARQFVQPPSRPDVDAIFGIPPTVAIEQRTSRGGYKSTVATLTEIYHFLRLLYTKLGTQFCPDCDVPIEPQTFDAIAAQILKTHRGRVIEVLAPLVVARKGVYTELAEWASGKGFATLRVDGEYVDLTNWRRLDRYSEHTIELPIARLTIGPQGETELRTALRAALDHGKGIVHITVDAANKSKRNQPVVVYSTRRACPSCNRSFAEPDPRLFSFNSRYGWCDACHGNGLHLELNEEENEQSPELVEYEKDDGAVCEVCKGARLNEVALHVRWQGRSISEFTQLSVGRARELLAKVRLEGREAAIAADLLKEIASRLEFLSDVGLDYLTLDRSAPTLSGGEAQRIRLAAQLGSNLQGVCYVLDEPTIGLHPRDNGILLEALERLARKGNSLLVVEHDEETIRRADHVIDLGPGAGVRGGQVVAQGTATELERNPASVTGRALREPLRHPLHPRRPVNNHTPAIRVRGAHLNNLRDIDVRFPLQRLIVVTGVSGSGKSTLARDVLHDNVQAQLSEGAKRRKIAWYGCEAIEGIELIDRVLEVDQTPIGKTPRSCPATYVGFWDAIRHLFAQTPEARVRGYTAARFSFNAPGGRCETCEGQGMRKVKMSFLPDVRMPCEDCRGMRFNAETLEVKYRDKNIGEVLAMNVEDALEFFASHRTIRHALQLLQDVGLGYLTLGQQSPTLSGGEAQRIKLVTELAKVRELDRPNRAASKGTLYILDEPTVGLHMADVEKLIGVLHRLVNTGNTVVVIEHNLDVIAEADWIIDLGPEGGSGGGKIVACGPPEKIAASARPGHSARVLKCFLEARGSGVRTTT